MVTRRIYVNLAAFATLFLVLAYWAGTNVVRLDRVERPYRITASFQQAPGLRPNVEVTYRGVSVGRVSSVRLAGGAARVRLAIDRGRRLPLGVTAAVRRRSAVGEPYVGLAAPAGWHSGDAHLPTDGSYAIPLSATSVPLSYGDLFASADRLLGAVDPQSLRTLTSELAIALGGRGDELRTLIGRSEDLTTTLAGGADDLDLLATQLTDLTSMIAAKRETIANTTDDLAVLVNSLAASAGDLDALLTRAPKLGDQVNSILAASSSQLLCGLAATGTIAKVIDTPANIARIVRLLQLASTASRIIPKAIFNGPDGPYLAGTFGFAPGNATATYDKYPTLPQPPPLPSCPGTTPPVPGAPGDNAAPSVPGPSRPVGSAGPGTGRGAGKAGAGDPVPAPAPDDGSWNVIPWVLAGAAAAAAAAALRKRPWRLLASRRGRDEDPPTEEQE